ncbi:IS4 family transposase [Gemmata sp. G18]|uniref:IS4 family transposase n=1 Tax=Gemmata palustris TaxID=2822762 RepID=A0ABS5C3M7_9BACT|nr:IS4 family transposase [Gemmata palustris]MBP3959456.1 IS4 family transposase [Gemmata palustris]MBP3960559.1 IS4 family transposase [Gemmata palustris]
MNPLPKSFGAQEFGDVELGDVRRTRRLVALADACACAPGHALPDKFHDPSGYQGALRLLRSPHVTHAAVLAPHQARTLDRAEAHTGTVLIVHDTTDLDFSGHRTLAPQLGPIGNGGGRGLLCHNSLAVDSGTGEILGLVAQQLHVRVPVGKNESRGTKRARATRESRLWTRALDEIGPAPGANRWVHVADRGADAFEFVSRLARTGERFVVRAQHDRSLGPGAKLFATARATPPVGAWELELPPTRARAGCRAQVRASLTTVTVPPPHNRKGEYPALPIRVHVVRVWEPDPGAGADPVEWLLLTSEPVTDVPGLRRVAHWYRTRWVIEEYHKGLKTGAGIERLQLDPRGALDPAIGVLSVVAVALVNLRQLASGSGGADRPAHEVVPGRWVEVLSTWRYKAPRALSAEAFVQALARLGGWIPRKQPPGWLVLWRGWTRLHAFLEFEAAIPKM